MIPPGWRAGLARGRPRDADNPCPGMSRLVNETTPFARPTERTDRMRPTASRRLFPLALLGALAVLGGAPQMGRAACCYFSAKDQDILQPAQKAFITWDPQKQEESFTVQPKFEGNALDFGMVIPTPSRPKLHEMPRDFFKELAVYSILKKREFPKSKLVVGKK